MVMDAGLIKVIGKSMMLGAQQFAIGSVLCSSAYSVKNFSKDQDTLQSAADALKSYIYVGVLWMISNMLVLGASYGKEGVIAALVANSTVMIWIWIVYIKAFETARKMYGLKPPNTNLFRP